MTAQVDTVTRQLLCLGTGVLALLLLPGLLLGLAVFTPQAEAHVSHDTHPIVNRDCVQVCGIGGGYVIHAAPVIEEEQDRDIDPAPPEVSESQVHPVPVRVLKPDQKYVMGARTMQPPDLVRLHASYLS